MQDVFHRAEAAARPGLDGGRALDEGITPVAGIALMSTAVLLFAVLDASAKYAGRSLPPLEVAWFRFTLHALFAIAVLRPWRNLERYRVKRPLMQLIRAACLAASTVCNFIALQYLQLAETVSIMYATPLLVSALAGPLIGEWAGPRRWAAIAVGFLGVMVVTRPGFGAMHWAAGFSVLAMVSYSIYLLTTRMLAATETQESLNLLPPLVTAMALAPTALFGWAKPASADVGVALLLTGIMGALGHFLLIRAHRLAPAPLLAPFGYTQIVWMVALGWLVFSDIPELATLIGAAIIVASGLYLLYREQVVARRARVLARRAAGGH